MEYQHLPSINQGNNNINKHDVATILSLKPNGYFNSCLKQQGGFHIFVLSTYYHTSTKLAEAQIFKIQAKCQKPKPLRQP